MLVCAAEAIARLKDLFVKRIKYKIVRQTNGGMSTRQEHKKGDFFRGKVESMIAGKREDASSVSCRCHHTSSRRKEEQTTVN